MEGNVEGGRPGRSSGLGDQLQSGLGRGPAALLAVALMAAADHIFPGGSAPLRARDDVIEVELAPGKPPAAILAGILIPGKNIEPAETDSPLGHPVIGDQEDDPRDFDHPVHEPYRFIIPLNGDLAPALVVKGLILGVHGFGQARVKEAKSPPNRSDVDGQERFVQHQDMGVNHAQPLG